MGLKEKLGRKRGGLKNYSCCDDYVETEKVMLSLVPLTILCDECCKKKKVEEKRALIYNRQFLSTTKVRTRDWRLPGGGWESRTACLPTAANILNNRKGNRSFFFFFFFSDASSVGRFMSTDRAEIVRTGAEKKKISIRSSRESNRTVISFLSYYLNWTRGHNNRHIYRKREAQVGKRVMTTRIRVDLHFLLFFSFASERSSHPGSWQLA